LPTTSRFNEELKEEDEENEDHDYKEEDNIEVSISHYLINSPYRFKSIQKALLKHKSSNSKTKLL
jgi:hypothetical protein